MREVRALWGGRWVCIVTVDGEDLAEWIKENGLAKEDLCEEGG